MDEVQIGVELVPLVEGQGLVLVEGEALHLDDPFLLLRSEQQGDESDGGQGIQTISHVILRSTFTARCPKLSGSPSGQSPSSRRMMGRGRAGGSALAGVVLEVDPAAGVSLVVADGILQIPAGERGGEDGSLLLEDQRLGLEPDVEVALGLSLDEGALGRAVLASDLGERRGRLGGLVVLEAGRTAHDGTS